MEDIAYHWALNECLIRSPSKLDVGTDGSQQKLTAHFAISGLSKLKFDLCNEARRSGHVSKPV